MPHQQLPNKIWRWFNETQAARKNFDYRFTGKDSRGFLHNFMFLNATAEPSVKHGTEEHFTLHVLASLCLTLQNCVSVFSRIEISHEQLVDQK